MTSISSSVDALNTALILAGYSPVTLTLLSQMPVSLQSYNQQIS